MKDVIMFNGQDIMKKNLFEGQIELIKKILYLDIDNIKNFNNVSDEKRNQIINLANSMSELYNYDTMGKDYFYRLLYDKIYNVKSKISLTNKEEKLAFIIETIDPNFEMFMIYDDNDNDDIIEKEITEKFGFYDKKLIEIEKKYMVRFIFSKRKPLAI